MRTPKLITLCEDANSIRYKHSKTTVCMVEMVTSVCCSFKCVNRNNLCFYYMRVSHVCVSWLLTCVLKHAEAYGHTEVKSVKVMRL